jgi:hypothetical protein
MPRDLAEEQTLIDVSRAQRTAFQTDWSRRYHEIDLLLTAGINAEEAERIVRRAAADRAASHPEGIAA